MNLRTKILLFLAENPMSTIGKKTRFDLEQEILDCWHVVDDINILFEALCNEQINFDTAVNILLGMKELYQLKFERTFNTFERVVCEGEGSNRTTVSVF